MASRRTALRDRALRGGWVLQTRIAPEECICVGANGTETAAHIMVGSGLADTYEDAERVLLHPRLQVENAPVVTRDLVLRLLGR